MIDLTEHRDHSMLDLSVVAAVQELASAHRTRILGLTLVHSNLVLIEHALVVGDAEAILHDHPTPERHGESMDGFSELIHCLEHHEPLAQRDEAGLYTLWLPVWLKDKANVCLEVQRSEPFDRQTIQIISGIIRVYHNFQKLLDYSERDALTGLFNRKTFDDQLAKMLANQPTTALLPGQLEQERRHESAAQHWLAVVDIDHFKRINDQFGHVYGDEVLILIANVLQSSFRTQDRVFRFGGEEFVVLLRSTRQENAHKIIERFRANVEGHAFPQVGQITASVGYVAVSAYESPVLILGHADQALYYAKTHGRNQVCSYDQLVEQGLLGKVVSNDSVEFF
jgi:diguanylate cyclase (GGDEF)-like protein